MNWGLQMGQETKDKGQGFSWTCHIIRNFLNFRDGQEETGEAAAKLSGHPRSNANQTLREQTRACKLTFKQRSRRRELPFEIQQPGINHHTNSHGIITLAYALQILPIIPSMHYEIYR